MTYLTIALLDPAINWQMSTHWGSTMNYLLSILIIAVVLSQGMMWHSLATMRDAIQQANAILSAACGSDVVPPMPPSMKRPGFTTWRRMQTGCSIPMKRSVLPR